MVDGQLPAKVKKDAHDIILEFIRSRPPLKPVSISIYVVKFPRKGYKIWYFVTKIVLTYCIVLVIKKKF